MISASKTDIPGVMLIKPRVFPDRRGYFFESYNSREFCRQGISLNFVQDNESRSVRNVIRGLHYQLAPHSQTKLLRVTEGEILDVVVDLRRHLPSFGSWLSVTLSAGSKEQLLIPKGCAHGFRVTSEKATVFYRCDAYYHPASERCILFSDERLAIDWGIDPKQAIVSQKDLGAPRFEAAEINFDSGNT